MIDIDVQELYQELILDHSRKPRNFRRPVNTTHQAEGFNPLCGDRVTVYLQMTNDIVSDAAFQGEGCAISKASASLMTESVKGKTRAEVESLFSRFHDVATGSNLEDTARLGKLAAFSGLRGFPTRVKCATLAWHALRAALERKASVVSTESEVS